MKSFIECKKDVCICYMYNGTVEIFIESAACSTEIFITIVINCLQQNLTGKMTYVAYIQSIDPLVPLARLCAILAFAL